MMMICCFSVCRDDEERIIFGTFSIFTFYRSLDTYEKIEMKGPKMKWSLRTQRHTQTHTHTCIGLIKRIKRIRRVTMRVDTTKDDAIQTGIHKSVFLFSEGKTAMLYQAYYVSDFWILSVKLCELWKRKEKKCRRRQFTFIYTGFHLTIRVNEPSVCEKFDLGHCAILIFHRFFFFHFIWRVGCGHCLRFIMKFKTDLTISIALCCVVAFSTCWTYLKFHLKIICTEKKGGREMRNYDGHCTIFSMRGQH